MKKSVNVVMLPSQSPLSGIGQLVFNTSMQGLFVSTNNLAAAWKGQDSSHLVPQHLYFTSSEEINEGDWYYWKVTNSIQKCFLTEEDKKYGHKPKSKDGSTKVVATTNLSLNLPLIPQSFVDEYVKSNGTIEEVHQIQDLQWHVMKSLSSTDINTKQQTLEEAAHLFAINISGLEDDSFLESMFIGTYEQNIREAFLAGAKYQKQNP